MRRLAPHVACALAALVAGGCELIAGIEDRAAAPDARVDAGPRDAAAEAARDGALDPGRDGAPDAPGDAPAPDDGPPPDASECNALTCADGCCRLGACVRAAYPECGLGGVACMPCDTAHTDRCHPTTGTCVCGGNLECAPALGCHNATCVACGPATCPGGCCVAATGGCAAPSHYGCGTNGSTCAGCADSEECCGGGCRTVDRPTDLGGGAATFVLNLGYCAAHRGTCDAAHPPLLHAAHDGVWEDFEMTAADCGYFFGTATLGAGKHEYAFQCPSLSLQFLDPGNTSCTIPCGAACTYASTNGGCYSVINL
ncbi:MAG TPA: hypothetical protein VGQ83_18785 [Polyangia bacterium]